MSTYISNIKITSQDIIKNWWKLNYFKDGVSPSYKIAEIDYGHLYNWYAMSDSRHITPSGWHVPTIDEFVYILFPFLGGTTVTGGLLKEIGLEHWLNPNVCTSDNGFHARGGGMRTSNFFLLKNAGFWGSLGYFNQEGGAFPIEIYGDGGTSYQGMQINNDSIEVYLFGQLKSAGVSLRLIKDDSVDTGTMTDNDGRVYSTVTIGTQVWMAENLRTTKYRNGDSIPIVTDQAAWNALTTGARCSYNNNLIHI